MKITWLGQAGLLMETEHCRVMVDPYLSSSVEKINPKNYRRVPVDPTFLVYQPDLILLTHDHLDHLDPETLTHYLAKDRAPVTVLAPERAWEKVRTFGGGHQYVEMVPHTVWSEGGLIITALRAAHSDPTAVGYIVDDGAHTFYITGDTLRNTDVIADARFVAPQVDVLFLPINGVGNNMNMTDAAAFAEALAPRVAVPLHFGMFDEIDPRGFTYPRRVIPQIYREIPWEAAV